MVGLILNYLLDKIQVYFLCNSEGRSDGFLEILRSFECSVSSKFPLPHIGRLFGIFKDLWEHITVPKADNQSVV